MKNSLKTLKSSLLRFLDSPASYRFLNHMLKGKGEVNLSQLLSAQLQAPRGLSIDVGCGPEPAISNHGYSVVGVDVHFPYVNSYVNRAILDESESSRWGVVGDARILPFADNSFEESRSVGLFHHLDDTSVRECLKEMVRVTQKGGSIVVFDNVWPNPAYRRPVAWLARRLDRGEFVRTESALRALVSTTVSMPWRISRLEYSRIGLVGLLIVGEK